MRRDPRVFFVICLMSLAVTLSPEGTAMAREAAKEVHLEDVEKLFRDHMDEQNDKFWQARSYVDMRLVCMKAAGWTNADYESLMAISGYAGTFCYHIKKFWPQYIPPEGADERMSEAYGFGWTWEEHKTPEAYWQALVKALDSGKPVHGPWLEEVLFVGYRDAPDPGGRMVKPLSIIGLEDREWWSWEEFRKWYDQHSQGGRFGCHTGKVDTADPRSVAETVLKNVVGFSEEDPRRKYDWIPRDVVWGTDGIRAYAADIRDPGKMKKPAEVFYNGWLGCHAIYPQVSGLKSMVTYLEGVIDRGLFGAEINSKLIPVLENYLRASKAWDAWGSQLGHEGLAPKNAWKSGKRRKTGAEAVDQAAMFEDKAIEAVRVVIAELE